MPSETEVRVASAARSTLGDAMSAPLGWLDWNTKVRIAVLTAALFMALC